MIRRPPRSTLFPYTRSSDLVMPALAKSPFWQNPKDPHLKGYVTQGLLGPTIPDYYVFNLAMADVRNQHRSEEHTSELQSRLHLVCRLLLEKKNSTTATASTC